MSTVAAFDLRRPAPLAPFTAPAAERAAQQLPVLLTSFVGREREMAAVSALLTQPGVRLLTLTGPGGVGKTRLALRILPALQAHFPGGIWFVELAPVADSTLVLGTVASVLGVRNSDGRPFLDLIVAAIGRERTLIVLDNLEHVTDAAPDIAALLAACAGLTILATSRLALRLGSERLYAIQPLPVHSSEGRSVPPAATTEPVDASSPAVALFAQRAKAIRPDFAITGANLTTVEEICSRLDGLPLAIELAAARTRVLSPAALLLRLDHRLNVLTGGPRDLPDRQRTLRDTIAWSYDLLPPDQQRLLQAFAVFAGGFTIETAETLVAPSPLGPTAVNALTVDPDSVLDHLADLVDGGLVLQDVQPNGETRFRMLETIREYAQERLEAGGHYAAVRSRHAALFADLVNHAYMKDFGASEPATLAHFGTEIDNIRAALGWLLRPEATVGDLDVSLRLSAGMERYFHTRGYVTEGRAWIDRALARGDAASGEARAAALGGLGVLAFVQQDVSTAKAALAREPAPVPGQWGCDRAGAGALFLGLLATRNRDIDALKEIVADLDPLTQQIEPGTWHPVSYTLKGHLARISGDLDAAARLFEHSRRMYTDHGVDWGAARLQGILSSIALEQNDLPRSLMLRQACLRTFWEHGDVGSVGSTLVDIALVATRLGQPAAAARLLGVAAGIQEATGTLISGEVFHDERGPTETRERLGDDAYAAGLTAGRALSTSAGVAEALAFSPTGAAPEPEDHPAAERAPITIGLTPREREVLHALVSGKTTNRDLADALFISPKTAGHHVDNIMAKMGVNSRVAAVALATREGFQ